MRPVESPYPQVPVDEARAAARAVAAPLPAERVGIDAARGRVLAEPLRADADMPPFAASARDGYALRAADGEAERRVVGEAVAGGAPERALGPGEAMRITTGAPLPPGADAVLMVEDSEPRADEDPRLRVRKAVAPGENVRPAGQDYARGDALLPAGATLGPAELGLLASVGAVSVAVHRRPRAIVFSTGDELVPPERTPGPGQIRDSNRFALAAALRDAGAEVLRTGNLADEEGAMSTLEAALAEADVVLTSGGVSMGHRDLVKPWLAARGEILFGRVLAKPGKPVTLARVDGVPVFALPGFPVSALVCLEVFARPALRRMRGHARVERPRWRARLAHDLDHAEDREEFARARLSLDAEGRPVARTTGFQGSGRLLSMAGANALLRLPMGRGHSPAGTEVEAWVLGPVHGEATGEGNGGS